MADAFNAGDVVFLKSGGPKMTVTGIEGNYAYCEWFDGLKPVRDKFYLTSLKKPLSL
jgi:uncharacterized protein YodC (DUF2158 family)